MKEVDKDIISGLILWVALTVIAGLIIFLGGCRWDISCPDLSGRPQGGSDGSHKDLKTGPGKIISIRSQTSSNSTTINMLSLAGVSPLKIQVKVEVKKL